MRCVEFNPNRCYVLATAGDDGYVRIWDTRYAVRGHALATIREHSHWWAFRQTDQSHRVWCVRYNTTHDQLFVTCGSDALVVLHSRQDVSSEAANVFGCDDATRGGIEQEDESALYVSLHSYHISHQPYR